MLTIGELLKREREKQGITLDDIEKKTRIREKYLSALEENNWDFFSSKIYITGIIKTYSRILGLDREKTLAFFRRDYEKLEEVKFKQRFSSKYLTPQTRKFAILGVGFVFLLFTIYFGFQMILYLKPPSVAILSPKTTVFQKDEKITIRGRTQKEATINIFGDRVFQNKEGIFEYSFPLKKGKNQLIIEVVGANGKKTVFRKTYIRQR